jgi:hypothetical protein
MRPFCLPYFHSSKREEFTYKMNGNAPAFRLNNLQQTGLSRDLTRQKVARLATTCGHPALTVKWKRG